MKASTITLLLQILVIHGPDAYKAALALYSKPTAIMPSDFDALTSALNKPVTV